MKRVLYSLAATALALLLASPFAEAAKSASGTPVLLVVYHSNPEGAKVIDADGTVGITPFVATYDWPPHYEKGQCIPVRSLAAIWITGPHIVQHNPTVCPIAGTDEAVVTFDLPAGESNRYINDFARSQPVLQASAHIDAFLRGGTLPPRGTDQNPLDLAYTEAGEAAHADLGRRIAATQARIQALGTAIQANQYQDAVDDAARQQHVNQAAGALGDVAGCAVVGGCVPTYAPPPSYPAAPKINLPAPAQPFSNPPVTCTSTELSGTVTTTCH